MRREITSNRIKNLLSLKGITITDLAKKIDVSQGTVSLWLNCQRKINTDYLSAIAKALDVHEYELLIDPLELSRMNFRRYFHKFGLVESDYDNFHILDEEISLYFREIIEKYRKKK